MKKVTALFATLLVTLGCLAQSGSPFSNNVFPAQSFTATAQTGAVIKLNAQQISYGAGTISVSGTSLTTVTFAVMGSSDNGVTYYALPISAVASPGSTPTTTATATAAGLYQVSLVGITCVKIVTSGTFTAAGLSLTLTATPNFAISRSGASSGGTSAGVATLPGTPNVVYSFVAPGDQACTPTTGTITDISGNSNNATLGATAPTCNGTGMTFGTSGAQGTIPAATGNNNTFCASVYMPVFTGPSGALTAPNFNYIIDSSIGNNGTGWIVGANNQIYQQQTYANGFQTKTNDAEAGFHTLCLVMGLAGNSTNDRFFTDGVEAKYASSGRSGGTNGANPWLFGSNFLSPYSQQTYYYFAGWAAQLTPAQILQASIAMNATVSTRGVQTAPLNTLGAGVYLQAIGDSITEAFGATSWVNQMSLVGGYTLVNQGIYGISAQANLGFDRWRDTSLCSNNYKTVAITFNGTNDLANGGNAGTTVGWLMAQANQLSKAGCIVGVGTMISRTGQDTNKNALNAFIRSQAAEGGYSVVDFASTALGADGAFANVTNFQGDGTHPTTAGQLILAGAASNWVNAYGFGSASATSPSIYSSNAVTMISGDRFATIIPTAAATATLPDCLGVTGAVYQIFNASAGANTITFSGKASEAIAGSATLAQNTAARFQATLISQAAAGCGWQRVQ